MGFTKKKEGKKEEEEGGRFWRRGEGGVKFKSISSRGGEAGFHTGR